VIRLGYIDKTSHIICNVNMMSIGQLF